MTSEPDPSTTTQLERRNRELSILNSIAQALNREVNLTSALQTALGQVADLLDLKTGWIWLLEEQTGASYLAASQNLPPALADNPYRMEGDCYCLDTFRSGDLNGAANVNVVKCSRLSGLVDGTDGLRYHSSIPLYAHDKRLGVLNVASTDWRELAPGDLQLLYTIGDLISMAVERARLFAEREEFGALEERNRLAREIHDTLAQSLAGIAMQLETADALLEVGDDSDRIRHSIVKALNLTRSSLEEARRSVLDLRAAPLEGRTLSDALADLVERLQRTSELAVAYRVTGAGRPLPVRIEAGVFRLAQEALTNVRRHAEARQVAVELAVSADFLQLSVVDDGIGFDPTAVQEGHFGLIGLRERTRLLGGTLNLSTSPGNGTELSVRIPLGEDKAAE